jgi:[acyl-carrier-protein] S-malonyltransferase
MSERRVAVLCPGRGSYTEKSLGSLARDHAWVARAEALRAERGLESLVALDGAARFESGRHLRPSNVSALIYLITMIEAERVLAGEELVAVAGNSMGWYTALALAGALSFDDGFRLVQEMSLLQEEAGGGGQVIHPVVADDWRRSRELEANVAAVLARHAGEVFPSIHLGGYEVLAGTDAGVAALLRELAPVELGKTTYPFRLAQHGPYHTPLVSAVARRAQERLGGLAFRRPRALLVDGRGRRFTPFSADAGELRAYTLGAQVDSPYDFTASVRVLLCEAAPDALVLPGPGNTLGGVCGQILCELGWHGVRTRANFEALQAGERPLVRSLHR